MIVGATGAAAVRGRSKQTACLLAGSLLIFLGAAATGRAEMGLEFTPPAVDKLKCEKADAPVAMTRDWHDWHGDKVDVAPRDLLLVARAYADGTDSIDPDPALARRLFETILASRNDATADAREGLAQLVLDGSADKGEIDGAIKQLEQAVGERDADAAVSLGKFYESGGPVQRDPAKALAYYRIGATVGDSEAMLGIARLAKAGAIPDMTPAETDQAVRFAVLALLTDVGRGDCQSLYWLGRLYDSGDLVPLNEALAARWYETAARAIGHSKAAEKLARMYAKGHGVEMSLPKMVDFLQIAAAGGRPRAMLALGEAYALGDGTGKDSAKAISWLEKADKAGVQSALRWLARGWRGEFGGKPDPAKSFAYLERDSERANPESKTFFELGEAYLDGTGTTRNVDAGLAPLRRAAALGHKDAAELIGEIFRDGRGVPADPLKAARYFRQAAAFGNVDAMTALADMHKCGVGVAWSPDLQRIWRERAAFIGSGSSLYDYVAALPARSSAEELARRFRLLRQAASLGSREAMVTMSLAYDKGIGIAADAHLAEEWRARAVAPGDDRVRGYLALARIYEEGSAVPRDMSKARALLEEIADAGDARGRYELTRFLTANGGADPATVTDDLVAAATAGSGPAMLSLSRRLDYGQNLGGKDRQGWLVAAAAAGEVKAKIALARQGGDGGAVETSLDRVAAGGVCQPDQMADLAMAYAALDSDAAAAKAKVWLDHAVAVGDSDPNLAFALGQALAAGTGGEAMRAKGIALLTGLAEAGTVKAMRQLATGYASGAWGDADKALAGRWLERAAAAGDAPSAVSFAEHAAAAERPDPAEIARAHEYLVKTAGASPGAARQLGELSIRGLFGEAERAAGLHWLQVAADAGDPSAMRDMANMFSTGGGGMERDPGKAFEWLRKAAEAGDAKSMLKLGAAYEAGFGIEADATQADHWYAAARQAGLTAKQ